MVPGPPGEETIGPLVACQDASEKPLKTLSLKSAHIKKTLACVAQGFEVRFHRPFLT